MTTSIPSLETTATTYSNQNIIGHEHPLSSPTSPPRLVSTRIQACTSAMFAVVCGTYAATLTGWDNPDKRRVVGVRLDAHNPSVRPVPRVHAHYSVEIIAHRMLRTPRDPSSS